MSLQQETDKEVKKQKKLPGRRSERQNIAAQPTVTQVVQYVSRARMPISTPYTIFKEEYHGINN